MECIIEIQKIEMEFNDTSKLDNWEIWFFS